MPLISVIIPSFNSEAVLERSLVSIIKQQFTDYEILVQDGGSQDKTMEVAERLKARFPAADLKTFSERDKGVYDAMNKGVQKASGDYVYFLGSDDELYNEWVLEKVQQSIVANGFPDLLYGNVASSVLGAKYDGAFTVEKLFRKNICHQAIFYKRALFGKYGGYQVDLNVLGDYEFNIRCFLDKENSIAFTDLLIARFNDGGLSSSISEQEHIRQRFQIISRYGWGVIPSRSIKADYTSPVRFYFDLIRFNLGLKAKHS